MTVVFMGTPDYATDILKKIFTCKDLTVSLLVTQEDKPVGRKQILTAPHIKKYVLDEKINLPIYQPKSLKNKEAYEHIKSFHPDFIVVAAYGQILPKSILDIAPCINLHASILPKYRGASPIQATLLNNDDFAGVTSMLMEEGLDTGDILSISYLKLNNSTKVDILFQKLAELAGKLTVQTLRNFSNILPIKQNNFMSSHTKKISKSDGLVDFSRMSAEEIYIKFKAYDPWPGIYLSSGLKLKEIELTLCDENSTSCEIISIDDCVTVACKCGHLKIKSVQPASKKQMNASEYIRGKRLEVGHNLV